MAPSSYYNLIVMLMQCTIPGITSGWDDSRNPSDSSLMAPWRILLRRERVQAEKSAKCCMGSGGTDHNHRQLFLPLAPFAMVPHSPSYQRGAHTFGPLSIHHRQFHNPSGVSMSTHLKLTLLVKQVGMVEVAPTTIEATRKLTRMPRLSSSTKELRDNQT